MVGSMTACYGLAFVALDDSPNEHTDLHVLHPNFGSDGVVTIEIAVHSGEDIKAGSACNRFPVLRFTTAAGKNKTQDAVEEKARSHHNKPLDARALLHEIETLIKKHRQNQKGVNKEFHIAREDQPPTPRQARLIEKVRTLILSELSNSALTPEQIAASLGLSLRQFHRRLKAAIGLTPAKYVRFLRLESAAQLLKHERDKNIAEIALMVGFKDPNYFSKVFKTLYELSPNQFRNTVL